MRRAFAVSLLQAGIAVCLTTCTTVPSAETTTVAQTDIHMQTIEITGTAQNLKAGAVLFLSEADTLAGLPSMVYVDGVHSWDDHQREHKMRVRGRLERRDDNPVIPINMPPDEIAQGIPTPEDQLDSARWRWWIMPEKIEVAD